MRKSHFYTGFLLGVFIPALLWLSPDPEPIATVILYSSLLLFPLAMCAVVSPFFKSAITRHLRSTESWWAYKVEKVSMIKAKAFALGVVKSLLKVPWLQRGEFGTTASHQVAVSA